MEGRRGGARAPSAREGQGQRGDRRRREGTEDRLNRIGLFGGSFNPIHSGHLRIARRARAELKLDRLLVIPAKESPFKVGCSGAAVAGGLDDKTRLALVTAVCRKYPGLEPCDIELSRGGVSYAIDTVRAVRRKHPGAALFFIIGEDSVAGLPRWKDYAALKRLVTFVPYPRTRESSTEIRRRLAAGKSIRAFVPPVVAELLEKRRRPRVPVAIEGPLPKAFGLSRRALRAFAAACAAASRDRVPARGRWHGVTVHLVHDAGSDAAHRAILGIAGATDVITQAYDAIPPEAPGLWGELIVNVDQAWRAAPKRRGWSAAKELALYVAHGMDHLSGADDYAPADYARMRRRELGWLRKGVDCFARASQNRPIARVCPATG